MRWLSVIVLVASLGCGETAKMLAGPPTGILSGWYCYVVPGDDGKPSSSCFDTNAECEHAAGGAGDACAPVTTAWCYLDHGDPVCARTQADCAAPAGKTCTERHKRGFSCWVGHDTNSDEAQACRLFADECAASEAAAKDKGTIVSQSCVHRSTAYCIGEADECFPTDRVCEDTRQPGQDGCLPTPH